MSSPGNSSNRHVSFHETTRPPPPYRHHPYQPPTPRMRIPASPLNYRYYEGPPPLWQQRDYYPPYDMPPRDEASPRPYMPPMHAEDSRRDSRQDPRQEPRMRHPPPQEYIAKREAPPPSIRYRFSDYGPPSPKRTKRYPGPPPPPQYPEAVVGTAGAPNKPGALSLLAKVAMGGNSDSSKQLNHQAGAEYISPVRRMPPSPQSAHSPRPIIWTPPDAGYRHQGPPPRGEWRDQPHPYPRRDYYPPPTWTYEGPQTPPALVERPSFEEGYYSTEGPYAQYDYPPPPSPDYRRYPPPPDARHQYITPTASRDMEQAEEAYHTSPYTFVQQPRLKEEMILRKKFSWKHFPELEEFLIASRDEYLRHSALNYTAEQKQYNNWLTERLMDVAARHHYVFDPEEFNFVAIRDRIRCYYKSYVQTARKRGQTIKKKQPAVTSHTPGTTQTTTSIATSTTQTTMSTTPCSTQTAKSTTPSTTEKDTAKTE